MGAWGPKLYQDDVALDVKDSFDDLRRGKTVQQITNQLIDDYSSELDDASVAPTFWFALADTQWNLGRLMPEVRDQALAWIEKGGDLFIWKEENPKGAIVREKVLKELQQKLNSPQPPEKKYHSTVFINASGNTVMSSPISSTASMQRKTVFIRNMCTLLRLAREHGIRDISCPRCIFTKDLIPSWQISQN